MPELSGYRLMWMIVLFDLPVTSKQARKQASDFRKSLLDNGFQMSQYSVYFRLVPGREVVETYVGKIRKSLPKAGKVDIVCITDRQYEDIISFTGKVLGGKHKNPTQLALF